MAVPNFWISIVKYNENWLLFIKNSARKGFMALGFNGKIIFGPMEETSCATLS
jgi:hypothetical protein